MKVPTWKLFIAQVTYILNIQIFFKHNKNFKTKIALTLNTQQTTNHNS